MDSNRPPRSRARAAVPKERFEGLLRNYDGDTRLDSVWRRLEQRRPPGPRRAPFALAPTFATAVAAAVALGFAMGRWSVSHPTGVATDEAAFLARNSQQVETHHAAELGLEPPAPRELARPSADTAAHGVAAPIPRARSGAPRRASRVPADSNSSGDSNVAGVLSGLEAAAEVPSSEDPALWIQLAEGGKYAAAFQALEESGQLAAVVAGGTPEELMTLADAARFSGRNGWAIQALREVTSRYESDENAPLAAMVLGNLLSRAGDAEGAVRAYALNRRLSPAGDFAEDALVREFGVACKRGEREAALRLLAEYERKYAAGEHLVEMKEALATLELSGPSSEPLEASEDDESDSLLAPEAVPSTH